MFTGLVEGTGTILLINRTQDGNRIVFSTPSLTSDLQIGSSIAVNGVCLTVEKLEGDNVTIFAVPETLKLTNIGGLKEGQMINLERAVRADTRLGGHIVQGHVEDQAEVDRVEKFENHWDLYIKYGSPYLIPKGSVAIDGISLTIHEISGPLIRFQIIPETIKKTNIPEWESGTMVNIETDYLVKAIDYIVRYRQEQEQEQKK